MRINEECVSTWTFYPCPTIHPPGMCKACDNKHRVINYFDPSKKK